MKILGVGGPFGHDAAACLFVDGKLVAAVEEERLVRVKHAPGMTCAESIRYCLDHAALAPEDIDVVAYPWSEAKYDEEKWRYAGRVWRSHTSRAFRALSGRFKRAPKEQLRKSLDSAGFNGVRTEAVEHHVAHAAASALLSGWDSAAVLSLDGSGEFVSTWIGEWKDGRLSAMKQIVTPDSLGDLYAGFTEYLGFDPNDGEFKVMGMAAYGDPTRFDMSPVLHSTNDGFHVTDGYVWVPRASRHGNHRYSRKLVETFGPPRGDESADEPYIHIAASLQKQVERTAIHLLETYLKKPVRLCLCGGVSLNIKMNQALREHPLVKELFVFPAAGDNGTPVGAAAWVGHLAGEKIAPLEHLYLGPEYGPEDIEAACRASEFPWRREPDIVATCAELLAAGEVVAWFQGRSEFGPRALGNRSILGHPGRAGMAEEINERIKFRERWRPFCPAILQRFAPEILGSDDRAEFMVVSYRCADKWKAAMREAVHVDGTIRPQVIDPDSNPRFNALVEAFYAKTGVPAVINTSLNRRGEPMIQRPSEAVEMFRHSGVGYLAMGDYLVTRS